MTRKTNWTKKIGTFLAHHRKVMTLFIIFGLPVAIFLSLIIYAEIASYIQTRNTPSEVRKAYENRQNISYRTAVEQELVASGVASEKIGETERSVCYIASGGAGWVTTGYAQLCYVRVTVGFYTSLSKAQVFERLQEGVRKNLFMSRESQGLFPDKCRLSSYDGSPAIARYATAQTPPSSVDDDYGYLKYEECGRPSPVEGLSSTSGKALGTTLAVKSIKGIDDAEIDTSRSQIWIEEDDQYFRQTLSCGPFPFPVFGCNQSREKPVQ